MKLVKYSISIDTDEEDTIHLPPYRFESDAKLAASQLVELDEVKRVLVHEIVLEQ